ncbi:MAG: hypothetical protein RR198_08395, partial [Oscillospiraceae bacterium]
MNKKQFFRFSIFTLLTLTMIYCTGQLFRDKDTTLSSFYSEPPQTIELISVGSSHVNSGVIPAVFWREEGINAHNVFSWGQPVWISYHYIKEAFRSQTPKVVVLDLFGMMYGNSGEQPKEIDETNYRNSFSIDPSLNFLQMTRTVSTCGIDLRDPIDFLNPIRFHTAWKNLSKTNFTYNPHKQHSYLKGFGIQCGNIPAKLSDTSTPVSPKMPYDTAVKYLEKIVQLSKDYDFKLIFVMLPYEYMPEERALFAWLREYSAENNIPFLNYCEEDGERIGFDFTKDFSDTTHVNYTGAYKLSRDMASFVAENYFKEAPTPPENKEQLDIDTKKVYRVLKVNGDLTTDVTDYFQRLKDGPDYLLIANVRSSDSSDLSPEFIKAMGEMGISTHKSCITLLENGKTQVYKEKLDYKGLSITNDNLGNKILINGDVDC